MPHAGSDASPDCSGGSLTHCPGQALSRTVRMTSLHSRQISGRPSSRASCSSRLWHSPQRQCPHGVAMDQTVVPGSSGRKVPKQQLQSLVYSVCCRIDLARSSSTRYLAKRILTAVGENLSRVARASLRDNRAQHACVRRGHAARLLTAGAAYSIQRASRRVVLSSAQDSMMVRSSHESLAPKRIQRRRSALMRRFCLTVASEFAKTCW